MFKDMIPSTKIFAYVILLGKGFQLAF